MKKKENYIIFYVNPDGDYDCVHVNVSSYNEACRVACWFNRKTGHKIVGVCLEYLLTFIHYE